MFSISRKAYERMIEHLLAVYPVEGCGFLSGFERQANQAHPVKNLLASPTAYRMDPREQVATLLDLEASGKKLMAIFHAHPDGDAQLSAADLDQITFPDLFYLVAALHADDTGSPSLRQLRAFSFKVNPGRDRIVAVYETRLIVE